MYELYKKIFLLSYLITVIKKDVKLYLILETLNV